jgi:hypothetical protein
VIMKGIDRRWIGRTGEVLAVRSGQGAEIIIEGVIFFYDDHDVFDCHRNLPARSGPARGRSRERLIIDDDGLGVCDLVHSPRAHHARAERRLPPVRPRDLTVRQGRKA